jgi:hypothetical protein
MTCELESSSCRPAGLSAGNDATKVYLIDPFVCEVKPVELHGEPGSCDALHYIYALLDCERIESVHLDKAGCALIVVGVPGNVGGQAQAFFLCRLWPHNAIAGKALWIGVPPDGHDTDPQKAIDYVRNQIAWAYRYSNQAYRLKPRTPARSLTRLRDTKK